MNKSGLCCLAMQPTNFLYFPAYKTHIIVLYITQYSFNFFNCLVYLFINGMIWPFNSCALKVQRLIYIYIWRTMRKLQAHKTKNESDAHVSRFSHVV